MKTAYAFFSCGIWASATTACFGPFSLALAVLFVTLFCTLSAIGAFLKSNEKNR